MTKRLISFLAGVVGAFAFVVAPAANAAIIETNAQSYVEFKLVSISGGILFQDVIVVSSGELDFEDTWTEGIAYAENEFELVPTLQPTFQQPVRDNAQISGWVLDGATAPDVGLIANLDIVNTSVNLVYVTLEVSGYVGAVVMAPDTANFSDAYTEAETYCSVSSLGVIAQAIAAAAPGYPSSEDPFFERITIPVPPGAGDKVFCEHRVWTISWFSTEESYDAAVTALDVPESLEVPPPRRQRFSVDVMNQGLEDIAGAVHLVASEGRPDRYMLPFDVLEPGELITLTSSSLWRPSMRADTVEWTATVELDDEYPDDEYPDNDVMTAETEMIRVRP